MNVGTNELSTYICTESYCTANTHKSSSTDYTEKISVDITSITLNKSSNIINTVVSIEKNPGKHQKESTPQNTVSLFSTVTNQSVDLDELTIIKYDEEEDNPSIHRLQIW